MTLIRAKNDPYKRTLLYYEYVKPDEFDDFEYPAEMTGILGLKKKEDTEGEAEAEQKSNKAFEEEHKE